jgi:phage terminase small subunit
MAKRAPIGLGKEGRALWRSIVDDIASRGDEETGFELDPRELAMLEQGCRLADQLVELEAIVAKQGRTVRGSTGQVVLHPGIAEIRQHRLALQRILGSIGIDTGAGEKTGASANRARHAANARWSRRDWQGAQLRVVGGPDE